MKLQLIIYLSLILTVTNAEVEAVPQINIKTKEDTSQTECTPGTYNCPHRGDEIALHDPTIPYIISPRRTKLLSSQPIFRWNAVAGATSYLVKLEEDGVEIWRETVGDNSIIYPGNPPLKADASYTLIVEADNEASSLDAPVIPGGIGFTVLDEADATRIQNLQEQIEQQQGTDEAKKLVIANLYLKNGLVAEAIALWEDLVNQGSDAVEIYNNLGDRYWENLALAQNAADYYLKVVQLASPQHLEERTQAQDKLGQLQVALENTEAAISWLTQAKAGYQALGNITQVRKLERQLEQLTTKNK